MSENKQLKPLVKFAANRLNIHLLASNSLLSSFCGRCWILLFRSFQIWLRCRFGFLKVFYFLCFQVIEKWRKK